MGRLSRGMNRVRRILRSATRRFGTWPLFGVILLWVVLALLVFTLLGWLWGQGEFWTWGRVLTNWRSAGAGVTALDVVKVSLTTIGGIGGTGYLVIKYRERASAERAEAEGKLLSAVQQLGSESPQVRIAGVYALADVADTYRGNYKQRVVNILCGCLRTTRDDDSAVESTVLEVLRRHLRKHRKATEYREEVIQEVDDNQLWCNCTVDFHGAVLTESIDFRDATFTSPSNFSCVKFVSTATFESATFADNTIFESATFADSVNFQKTVFDKPPIFMDAIFSRKASFKEASICEIVDGAMAVNLSFFRSCFNLQYKQGVEFPEEMMSINSMTGLPHDARWARFDDNGGVIELLDESSLESTEGDGKPPASSPA